MADGRHRCVVRRGVHPDRAGTRRPRQRLNSLDRRRVGRIARDHDPRAAEEQVSGGRPEPARLAARHRVAPDEAEPVRRGPGDDEGLRARDVRHDGRRGAVLRASRRRAGPAAPRHAVGGAARTTRSASARARSSVARRGVDDPGCEGAGRARTRRAPGCRSPATGLAQSAGHGAPDQAKPEEGDVHRAAIAVPAWPGAARATGRGAACRIAAPPRGARHRPVAPGHRAGSGGGPPRGAGRRAGPGSAGHRSAGSDARRRRATPAARSRRCSGRTTSRQGGACLHPTPRIGAPCRSAPRPGLSRGPAAPPARGQPAPPGIRSPRERPSRYRS